MSCLHITSSIANGQAERGVPGLGADDRATRYHAAVTGIYQSGENPTLFDDVSRNPSAWQACTDRLPAPLARSCRRATDFEPAATVSAVSAGAFRIPVAVNIVTKTGVSGARLPC